MIRFALARFPRWLHIAMLAIVALLVLPSISHAAVTTDVTEFFRYTYGVDRLLYIAAQEIVLWRILSRKKSPVGGRGQWLMPIQTKNTGVFVGHAEGGPKTTRRAQPDTIEAAFSLQEFHGIWDISWKMLNAARKSEWAFQKAIDFMDESFKRRVMRLLNADLLGTGLGELGILPAADDGDATITTRALPLVDRGMLVDLMSSADNDTKVAAARTVNEITVPTRAVALSGANIVGSAAGDYLTVADSVSAAGSMHMVGLRAWLSESNPAAVVGNIGNIDRTIAGNGDWKSNVLSFGGTLRTLDDDLMISLLDTIRERGGKPVTDWISNLPILRRYHESLTQDVFYAMGEIRPFGAGVGRGRDEDGMKSGENSEGETIYRFSGIPWRAEMFFDANKVAALNREHFFIGYGQSEVPRPLSEIFGDDMTTFFTTTNNTTWEVVSYFEGDLLGDNPAAGGMITDIAES